MGEIIKDGNVIFRVPFEVMEVFFEDDVIIVISYYNAGVVDDKTEDNVFGYNSSGAKLWKIAATVATRHSPYTGLYKIDKDIFAYNRNGVEVQINPVNGSVIGYELIK